MSKKRRNDIEELNESLTSQEPQEEEIPKIPFAHWFNNQLVKGKVKFYQDEALLVYFKKKGLSELEDEDLYNRTFENF